jgi:protein pelota
MRVVHRSRKDQLVKLRPETLDDLWHLYNLIEPGDEVTATTYRTADEVTDKIRAEKTPKQKMTLRLGVERVEFAEFSDRLRIMGTILEGPQDHGMHHTFNVEAEGFDDFTLHKPRGFKPHHWERIDEAVEAAKRPLVTILSMDDEEAVIAVLRQYGVQTVATIKGRTHGKQYEERDGGGRDYFGEVLAALRRTRKQGTPLIVVGPGFTREDFLAYAKDRDPDVVKDAVTEGTGQAGSVGVQEALKRGIVERIQRDQQVAVDTRMVEKVFAEIARDGAVAYGPQQVALAVEMGAVETLLVTDELLRNPEGEDLLTKARRADARWHVVAVAHEAGKKLASLGGRAALLRYKINA